MSDSLTSYSGSPDQAGGWIVLALGSSFCPPIVLLHGFMQDEHSWDLAAQSMAANYYLSMPRMSAATPEAASIEALTQQVYGVVQQAVLHTGCSRVVLAGYSMGGRIALEYAHRYPSTISTLVLESAGLGPEDEADRERMRQANMAMVQRIREASTMDEIVDYWESLPLFDSQAELPEEVRGQLRQMRLARDPQELASLLEYAGAHQMTPADQTRQMLRDLGIPVLYIAGMRDQKYADIATSLGAYGVQPVLLECGHCVHYEMPSQFAMVLTGFVEHTAAASN